MARPLSIGAKGIGNYKSQLACKKLEICFAGPYIVGSLASSGIFDPEDLGSIPTGLWIVT